uniref:Uncharacterized protein n=1 Tax=Cucumis melo TaxID=3656 RepID=A0A9I9ELV3_CUCME
MCLGEGLWRKCYDKMCLGEGSWRKCYDKMCLGEGSWRKCYDNVVIRCVWEKSYVGRIKEELKKS